MRFLDGQFIALNHLCDGQTLQHAKNTTVNVKQKIQTKGHKQTHNDTPWKYTVQLQVLQFTAILWESALKTDRERRHSGSHTAQ